MKTIKDYYELVDFKIVVDLAPEPIQEMLRVEDEFLQKIITPGSVVLEAGCGYGRVLKKLVPLAKKLVGVDFSKPLLDRAKKLLAGDDNVELHFMNIERMKFEDDSFDFIICMDSTFGNMPEIELDVLKVSEAL